MTRWIPALELDADRTVTGGSPSALGDAIRRGADLRIYTEFRHNEHLDTTSDNPELIKEVSEFGVTYLVDDAWTAGIMSLRQPIDVPNGFGPRPSMSFFLYNQDGEQAIARPYLDGGPVTGRMGLAPCDDRSDMPKYHQHDNWDAGTNAPSWNFVYDFERYIFFVCDQWREVLSHDEGGAIISGSIESLSEAFARGCALKVGVRDLCADLLAGDATARRHEVFIQCGPGYYYTGQQFFLAGTHPLVRVRPAIPMQYGSGHWDFGWAMPRTDGLVAQLLYDPYTLHTRRKEGQYALRWFISGDH